MPTIESLLTNYSTCLAVVDLFATMVTLIGIPGGIFLWSRSRRKITIFVSCRDGADKGEMIEIGRLPKNQAVRSEIVGLVTMKAGKGRMDLSDYTVDQAFRGKRVVVPLREVDFKRWKPKGDVEVAARNRPQKGR